ncbi:MAG: hypothetical protein PHF51_03155 [Candidatus ainarchaeum sp.]|nr:hypothetical protein [Candidatus ainarchaeum sp.]
MQLSFLQALIITNVLEAPALAIFYPKRALWKVALLMLAFNALTLPFVWFFFYPLIADYALYLVAAESFAFIVEAAALALVFPGEGWRNAALASAAANALSAGAGLLLALA